jgi:hypothetical protein
VAGIVGWAMSSGAAHASSTSPAASTPALRAVSPADAARVLETATAKRAIRAWGPVEKQVLEIAGGSQPVLVLTHYERDIYTFIDNSRDAHSSAPVAISLGAAPTGEHALRYYTVNGGPLADLTLSDGHTTVTPVRPGPGEAVPDITKTQIACWLGCIGYSTTSPGCITACENCFYYAVGTVARVAACTQCVICAGPNGVNCLRVCNII